MKSNSSQKILAAGFCFVVAFWAFLFFSHHKSGNLNYLYSFLFGLIPLCGGAAALVRGKIWGGLHSALGRAITFIALGLVLWGAGETVWSYYNFIKHVPAPYPSLADLGFAPSIFFWIVGTFFLSQATGAIFALKRSHWAKVFAIGVPVLFLIPSYYLQVKLAKGGVLVPKGETILKTVLDIAYPFGDFLALTFSVVIFGLSHRLMGGNYRKAVVFLLAGLAVMYAADSVFSYTTTKNTYYNADFGDLLLALGLFFMTYGVLAFFSKPSVKKTVSLN